MESAKKCVIHIGMHKTGSSSIQNVLFRNRDALLKDHNVNYFEYAANHADLYAAFHDSAKSHPTIINKGIYTDEDAQQFGRKMLHNLEAAIVGSNSDLFVLSAEGFSLFTETGVKKLQNFLAHFFDELTVSVYVREPFGYANSVAQEIIKRGGTFDELLMNTFGDATGPSVLPRYRLKVEKYQKIFGSENVRIQEFNQKELYKGNVVFDFAYNFLGISEGKLEVGSGFDNSSLSHDLIVQLERLNKAVPYMVNGRINPKRSTRMISSLNKIDIKEKFQFNALDLHKFGEAVAEDVGWLRVQTAGRIDFDLLPPQVKKTTSENSNSDLILAFNNELLKSEFQLSHTRFFQELWRLSFGDIETLDNLDTIILRCRDADFLIKSIRNLRKMGLHDQAIIALDRVLDLTRNNIDPELFELATKMKEKQFRDKNN